MVYVLAVAAALSNALCSVFQRMGVEDAPEESTMRLSLLAHAIRRGVWLLGFAFMVCALVDWVWQVPVLPAAFLLLGAAVLAPAPRVVSARALAAGTALEAKRRARSTRPSGWRSCAASGTSSAPSLTAA